MVSMAVGQKGFVVFGVFGVFGMFGGRMLCPLFFSPKAKFIIAQGNALV